MVGGRESGGGEAGISQIDEEIPFEERLIDKCRHEHKSEHVNVGKINLRGSGSSQERLSGQYAADRTHERIIIPSTHVQQQAAAIYMRIFKHAFPLIYTLKSDERAIIGTAL